ncbi:hypothetical protein R1sor_007452 [Riccia sorocarpa]|uniref:Photosynthetic NDH subcomplex B 4 n=1 Tax=Riccia sorocarpa TaxID=122646 RepID=A0ABD3HSN9_9MARC
MAMAVVGIPLGLRSSLACHASCSSNKEAWTSESSKWSNAAPGTTSRALRNASRLSNRGRNGKRAMVTAALFDPHSLAFLADLFDPQLDPSKFVLNLDLTNPVIEERSDWALSEEAMKHIDMTLAFVFCWGCCVFGSMSDKFYESDFYRDAGGNGTGHWIYDMEAREEAAARDEMWSEEVMRRKITLQSSFSPMGTIKPDYVS